jgi:hypothetical protein
VKLLGRYQGKNGQIDIVECSWDGTRVYFEEGIRQSQATPDGESVFTYVKLMDELLSRSEQVLVLGCGGGNLATRLSRLGKRLTIVDINPISFVLAHRYFDLPDELPCIEAHKCARICRLGQPIWGAVSTATVSTAPMAPCSPGRCCCRWAVPIRSWLASLATPSVRLRSGPLH